MVGIEEIEVHMALKCIELERRFISEGVEYKTTTKAVKKTIISRLIEYRYTNCIKRFLKIRISNSILRLPSE